MRISDWSSDVALPIYLPANAATGALETTNLTIYDSLGVSHLLSIHWEKNAVANQWDYTIDVTNNGGTTSATLVAGSILFDATNGTIEDVNGSGTLVDGDAARTTIPTTALTRSEEHTSEHQSLMRISYAVFCLKTKNHTTTPHVTTQNHSSYISST